MLRLSIFIAAATAALVLLGSAPRSADAATFVVDRFDDPTPNLPRCTSAANDCSLREAILEANATPGTADQITLRAGRYNLTRVGVGAGSGDLDIVGPLTIVGGSGQTVIDANDIDRVFEVDCAASCRVEFNRLKIMDGLSTGGGAGGIMNGTNSTLMLRNSIVTSNSASGPESFGAGILNLGDLTVLKSTVSFNVGDGELAYGGGIFNNGPEIAVVDSTVSNNTALAGGGVYVTGGSAFINRSAIIANTATGSMGGGGIYSANSLVLRNSTLSGNSADGVEANGGGLLSGGFGPVTIENATVKDNTSGGLGDGIYHHSNVNGSLSYKHTIFDNVGNPGDENCAALYPTVLSSLGKNIFTDDSCPKDSTSDFPYFTDPKLGPLRDNGGLSLTHAPQPGSPALNGGSVNSVDCAGPRDQRGQLRPVGAYCDIGAFEAQVCFPGDGEFYYLGFETISGTRRPDDIEGTPGRDVIMTFEGNDTVSGLGGNDRICSGAGDDTLNGDGGTDSLHGGSGSDTCNGGPPDTGEARVSCEQGIP
ncbi:MAG: choice-of-anchor Q domain-containing protein [Dehalococcoidia bacterium]